MHMIAYVGGLWGIEKKLDEEAEKNIESLVCSCSSPGLSFLMCKVRDLEGRCLRTLLALIM